MGIPATQVQAVTHHRKTRNSTMNGPSSVAQVGGRFPRGGGRTSCLPLLRAQNVQLSRLDPHRCSQPSAPSVIPQKGNFGRIVIVSGVQERLKLAGVRGEAEERDDHLPSPVLPQGNADLGMGLIGGGFDHCALVEERIDRPGTGLSSKSHPLRQRFSQYSARIGVFAPRGGAGLQFDRSDIIAWTRRRRF